MLRNLLVTSLRSVKNEKGYTVIHVLGLSIGISCSLLLLLYILDELSYDRHHANADNLYRVVMNVKEPDSEFTWSKVQIPLATELSAKYPEVVSAVRFFTTGRELFQQGDTYYYEEGVYYADSTAFRMFTHPFLAGDATTALEEPFSAVLSESMALKYFGSTDVLGKSLQFIDRNEAYKITGVMEDVPLNSHFHFDALLSINSLPQFKKQVNWGRVMVHTYVQLREGFNPASFESKLDTVVAQHVKPVFEKMNISVSYDLQPITDIHLHSKLQEEVETGGDISTLYIFSVVAVFMLVIACINYMNLATARSARRAREVGLRKVMGSFREELIVQFIVEALIITFIAFALSLLLIYLILPLFNGLTEKALGFGSLFDYRVIVAMVAILLLTGVAAGSYPAFYLSRFDPAAVLKGKTSLTGGNVLIRKTLVVLQFSISIFMLIATLVVSDQLSFLMNKDLGFDKERVIRIAIDDPDMRMSLGVFKNKLMADPAVKQVATSSTSPGESMRKNVVKVEDNDGLMAERGADWYSADYDYVQTLGLTMVAGRSFNRDILSDTALAVLVNEAMVRRMNWEQPLGKRFQGSGPVRQVIGVIKDYHQSSLYDEIEPLLVLFRKDNYYTFIKTDGSDPARLVASVEKAWQEVFPTRPFEYQFLDQAFDAQYRADQRKSTLFAIFSVLTIFIACLGLLGLTAYTTEQRAKEIGIRKVIGASTSGIVYLISREFILLIVLAAVLAFPAAWFFLDRWLQDFVYRIEMQDEKFTFLLSALLAAIVCGLTVGYYALKAANSNPVASLRAE